MKEFQDTLEDLQFEVLTAVTMKITIFWNVMLRGTDGFLGMSSNTSVMICQTSRFHIPEDSNLPS
jgi:hypothetical protein